jgi:branched-subunit amino acid aminotransferase/4-amino-4-deoxychorismate lyase
MHYYLADRAARQLDPQARALLLDAEGCVSETSTANILAYRAGEGLISPPPGTILPGISLATVRELAAGEGMSFVERPLKPADLVSADEVLLASTPSCLLPVTRFEGRPIGTGRPGEIFHRLLFAWDRLVGLDIAVQARTFAGVRNSTSEQSPH